MLEKIFSNYNIDIFKDNGQFVLRYDSGGIVTKLTDIVISENEAKIAQRSSEDAYNIVIKYQNEAKYKNKLGG